MDLFDSKEIKPMLIKEMLEPFNSKKWIYELKLDGIQCIAYLDEHKTELRSMNNLSLNKKFPELSHINKSINMKCILDGELIVIREGRPDFNEVQRRTIKTNPIKIKLGTHSMIISLGTTMV